MDSGVAQWGEAEREGLERAARAKSIETLRVDHKIRLAEESGADEVGIRDLLAADCDSSGVTVWPAHSCLEEGPS